MSVLQALILSLVQGITEFLPISSSAHLILTPYLFGWGDQGLTFDIVTNTGTLIAVVLYFRRDLWQVVRRPLAGVGHFEHGDGDAAAGEIAEGGPPLAGLIALATMPVVVAGLSIYGWLSTDARNPQIIAGTSIFFALLLFWADHRGSNDRGFGHIGWRDALLIGLAQALALVPGTSRSGVTLTAALLLGFERRQAARFSFLIAIPVSVAALLHDLKDLLEIGATASDALLPYAVGLIGSAVSAFLVIGWLMDWVERQRLDIFVVYRILLGLIILGIPFVQ